MHLDLIHHTTAADNTTNCYKLTHTECCFSDPPCMSQGQEIEPCKLQHCWSSFHFPDSIYLGFHCMPSSFCLARTSCIKRAATPWQQLRGASSPVPSPASLEVKWDAMNCTEYAKRKSYRGNLCSPALK